MRTSPSIGQGWELSGNIKQGLLLQISRLLGVRHSFCQGNPFGETPIDAGAYLPINSISSPPDVTTQSNFAEYASSRESRARRYISQATPLFHFPLGVTTTSPLICACPPCARNTVPSLATVALRAPAGVGTCATTVS